MTDRYFDEDGQPLEVKQVPGGHVMVAGQVFNQHNAELLAIGIRHANRQRGPQTLPLLFDTEATVNDIEGQDEVQLTLKDDDFAFTARMTRAQARELQNALWTVQNREGTW